MLQSTTSEGLVQGLYVAARVGFEPVTLLLQGTEPTTEPPRPPIYSHLQDYFSTELVLVI